MIVDAFYNYESAIQRAEEVRKKRIASLKRQIEKLEKLSFNKQ